MMIRSPNLAHLKYFCQLILYSAPLVIAVPIIALMLLRAPELCFNALLAQLHAIGLIRFFLTAVPVAVSATYYLVNRSRVVYLVDYACFRPGVELRVPLAKFKEYIHLMPTYCGQTGQFVSRVLERSGIGNETCLPSAFHYIPLSCSFTEGRAEAELVIFSAIDDLLAKTCIKPTEIDIIIVNCSVFSPTPSFSDMIINRYKLRSDIRSVHLSGMGCSAGLISEGLAQELLKNTTCGRYALVVSTETISDICYHGRKRSMHLPSILFRMGGAAALLSNSRNKALFQLKHLVRRITSTSERAYRCVILEEDEDGHIGLNLSKDLIAVSSNALKTSISAIGNVILPISEKLLFLLSYITMKLLNGKTKLYVPKFSMAIEHFCIHAGGPAVIDAVQNNLGLSDLQAEPSRMTFHRFGNTSSSSLWYELAYIEAKDRMQKGNRVLMIGFGSGYKCNIAVWECIQPRCNPDGPWANCIHRYPVEAPMPNLII